MPEITFEVWCGCGNGLCNVTDVSTDRGVGITVGPCDKCMLKAKDEGSEEGRAEGYEAGYDKGYERGYDQGHDAGYAQGESTDA